MRVAWLSFGFVEYCAPIANALTEHSEVALLLSEENVEPILDEIDPAVRFLTCQRHGSPRSRTGLRPRSRIVDLAGLFNVEDVGASKPYEAVC